MRLTPGVAKRIVKLTAAAADDLNDTKAWLHQHGAGPVARRRYRAILLSIQGLQRNPARYRRHPDDPTLRIVSIEGYRVIYRVDPDTGDNDTAGDVTVLAILGPGEP